MISQSPPLGGSPAKKKSAHNLAVSAFAYNCLTLTDGASRMIVLLHASDLGFDAVEIAIMFVLYEVAGVVTNLVGGVYGARRGMRWLLLSGIALQILGLALLCFVEPIFGNLAIASSSMRWKATVFITVVQALLGVAKDLMKIQGKATPKLVTKSGDDERLFKLVAWLTGAKNSTKGVGHFVGSALVGVAGYIPALSVCIAVLVIPIPFAILYMDADLGKGFGGRVKGLKGLIAVFKKGFNVNVLSAARFFLFSARDVWFEVPAPLFLKGPLGWTDSTVGVFMAGYIIIYGQFQASTTKVFKRKGGERTPQSGHVWKLASAVATISVLVGVALYAAQGGGTYEPFVDRNISSSSDVSYSFSTTTISAILITGLAIYAAVFAFNSAVHSYLIVKYSNKDKVAADLGFYYCANAGGRLIGTLISGFLYQKTIEDFGLSVCLWVSSGFLGAAALVSCWLRRVDNGEQKKPAAVEAVEIAVV